MKIQLLPSSAERIARAIVNGSRVHQVSDIEVVKELLKLDPDLVVYREEGGREIEFNATQIQAALERGIEMRPT